MFSYNEQIIVQFLSALISPFCISLGLNTNVHPGHNWGSEHDPDIPECSPSASQVSCQAVIQAVTAVMPGRVLPHVHLQRVRLRRQQQEVLPLLPQVR